MENLTRLEKQILEAETKLSRLKNFASKKTSEYKSKLPIIYEILKKRKLIITESNNYFVDFSPIDGSPIFRSYIKFSGEKLSKTTFINFKQKLKDSGITSSYVSEGCIDYYSK